MSTINLNLNNVEELLFSSNDLCKKLTKHKDVFNQWKFAYMHPSLRSLRKKIEIDFLKSLDMDDLEIIGRYFNTKVTIDSKADYKLVKNIEIPIAEAEKALNASQPDGYMTSYRDEDTVYISFWR